MTCPLAAMRRSLIWLLVAACLFSMLPTALAEASPSGVITANSLNLREGPYAESGWLGTYHRDTVVEILGQSGNWYQVRTPDGLTGYMSATYVEQRAGATFTETASVTAAPQEPVSLQGVQQVGIATLREYSDDTITFAVYYPILESKIGNAAIRRWMNNTLYAAKALEGVAVKVEAQYDAHLVMNRYIGVFLLGAMHVTPPQEHSLAYAMNIDTQTDTILGYQEIFGAEQIHGVLAYLQETLALLGETRVLTPDALQYAVLTADGVRLYLPAVGSMAARMITLPYDALAAKGLLALDTNALALPPAIQAIAEGGGTNEGGPMIALTFDDGPSKYTPEVLDVLAHYGVKATFFVVGNRINNFSEILARTAQEGHEIGIHTWSHQDLEKLSDDGKTSEIQKTINAIARVTDTPVQTLRPPYGSYDKSVRDVCRRMGLSIIMWNIDTEDWRTNSASATYDEIMNNVHDGCIILCHDLKSSTPEAVAMVVPELLRRGYQLVTVSELLAQSENGASAGSVYSQYKAE